MPTRRHVLQAAAAAALTVARPPAPVRASAAAASVAKYDLLIRGGGVIDPARRHDAVVDVAIANGRIAAVGRNLPVGDAAEVLEAGGTIVTPGLVDIHVHS